MSHLCSIKIPLFSSLGDGCCVFVVPSAQVFLRVLQTAEWGLSQGNISQKLPVFSVSHLKDLVLPLTAVSMAAVLAKK